jgi:hypothetical protein
MEKQLCAPRNSRIALLPALRTTTRSFCMAPPTPAVTTTPPGPPPTGLFPLLGPATAAVKDEPGNDVGGPNDPMNAFGFIVEESFVLSDVHDQRKVVSCCCCCLVGVVVLDVSCTHPMTVLTRTMDLHASQPFCSGFLQFDGRVQRRVELACRSFDDLCLTPLTQQACSHADSPYHSTPCYKATCWISEPCPRALFQRCL